MKISFAQGLAKAIREALAADPRVVLIGSGFMGLDAAARALLDPALADFSDRVLATPISELALAGAGIGAAMAGQRPLVDLSTGSFIFQAFPQVVNEAANAHYMTGGQTAAPVTFYSLAGMRGSGAAQHSHRIQGMLAQAPGLQIVLPASAEDAYHLLKWCLLESRNPTCFISHALLLGETAELDPAVPPLPLGRAKIRRDGRDVTIIASSITVPRALEAASLLSRRHGISAEVVDLRSLVPLDRATILASVARTGRAVIADECCKSFGVAAEIAALLAEDGLASLKALRRVAVPDVPVPYSAPLELELTVTADKIAAGALAAMKASG